MTPIQFYLGIIIRRLSLYQVLVNGFSMGRLPSPNTLAIYHPLPGRVCDPAPGFLGIRVAG